MKRSNPKAELPFQNYKLIIVWWLDAVASRHPPNLDLNNQKLAENFSIGWLLDEDATRIVVCSGSGTTGEAEILQIPTSNIIRWKTLRPQRTVITRRKK